MSNNKNQKQKSTLKQVAVLSGVAIQMGVTIYLFAQLGKWIDTNYNNGEKLYIIFCTLFGVAVSFYVLLKQLKSIHK